MKTKTIILISISAVIISGVAYFVKTKYFNKNTKNIKHIFGIKNLKTDNTDYLKNIDEEYAEDEFNMNIEP